MRHERAKDLVARDGCRIRYWLSEGPAVDARMLILLHGGASNHTRWSELLDHTSLVGSWTVARPDLRGNGQSMVRGRLVTHLWCDDLAEILNQEGKRRALFVGHSLGAHIALWFAGRYPAATEGLVLIDPLFRGALAGRRRWGSRLGPLYRFAALKIRMLNALGLRRRSFPDRDLRELDRQTRRQLLDEGQRDQMVKKYTSKRIILRYMPTANYLQQAAEMLRPLPALETIETPVLVITSTGSSFTDPTAVQLQIDRFPDAETVRIDAHHWPLTEKPDEVCEAVEDWIGRRFGDGGPV
jgi:pimeloyl-ACP methyl ester carboxylesterase